MARCPNCSRETLRTQDWACYLCGYPLVSPNHKIIEKTYKQVNAERLHKVQSTQKSSEPQANIYYDDNYYREGTDSATQITPEESTTVENECAESNGIDNMPSEFAINNLTPIQDNNQYSLVEEQGETCETEAVEEPPVVLPDKTGIVKELESRPCVIDTIETDAELEEINLEETTGNTVSYEQTVYEKNIIQVDIEPEPADLILSIDELLAEYVNDNVAADTKFFNKTIRLTGFAASIDIKEVMAMHYIRMTDSSMNVMRNVQCMFDKKYAESLRELEKGQNVTIQGKYTGSLIAMRISDCILI